MLLLTAILFVSCHPGPSSLDLRDAHRLGPKGTRVELIVFSDFQCSFCKRAARELKRIHTAHPGRIAIYFKHFPLTYHPQAINAAMASEAAAAQGKFWEMHDLLFANASDLNDGIYVDLAKKLGLDVERFETDMRSFEVANKIAADRAEGEAIKVDGTPFFIIDRRPFHGSYDELEEALFGSDWYR